MTEAREHGRRRWLDIVLLALAGLVFVTLIGLGNWQMRRLSWKLDLIEAVETRAHGDPVAPPEPPVTQDDDAYLRVEVTGSFRHDSSLLVKAVTEIGPGFWLMTPLDRPEGAVWINRGFVPASGDWTRPEGRQRIEGLLRITEPGGTLLEKNDPEADRWVSRDIAAMNAATGIDAQPGYFIDADQQGSPDAWPRGGLTIIDFRNSHLSYALTWYAMALLLVAGMAWAIRDRIRGD
ncbi:SURF1 family protein [Paracoccus sp. PARArs4]|uniref:SURF1 family protein n=1 Tax=Paracoccus sp. PARArs4 TaxID=2853442 RepID=UPI0024A79220|nr:SURF1 family protein [Paracoccus sp. PARArs4]